MMHFSITRGGLHGWLTLQISNHHGMLLQVKEGHAEVVKVLLDAGVDPNTKREVRWSTCACVLLSFP